MLNEACCVLKEKKENVYMKNRLNYMIIVSIIFVFVVFLFPSNLICLITSILCGFMYICYDLVSLCNFVEYTFRLLAVI